MGKEVQNGKLRGRGAQYNPDNKFDKYVHDTSSLDAIDEYVEMTNPETQYIIEQSKSIVNQVNSPDVGMIYSLNPYQGCEHGCVYCYARNSHQYWGYSAGLDFETRIVVKQNSPQLLKNFLSKPNYRPQTISLSGNTDCYQPAERKFKITRQLLEIFLECRHPVSIITKNYLLLRDIDLIEELAKLNLIKVMVSVTSLNTSLQLLLEPRSAPPAKRLRLIEELSKKKIPVGIMNAPIIPGLNDHEIPKILEECSKRGARSAGFIIVRLNGQVKEIFENWAKLQYADKAEAILNKIAKCHGGSHSDSRFGTRMRGEGKIAEAIGDLFRLHRRKFFGEPDEVDLDTTQFRRPGNGQLYLF